MPRRRRCWWLARWWHARLRTVDRRWALPALVRASENNPTLALIAFNAFIEQEGQAHWCCPCGQPEAERECLRLQLLTGA